MRMDGKRILLDALAKLAIIAALLIFLCLTLAKIGERLDEQDRAQQAYIQNYKAELKAEQTKDEAP